jgi:hypothetical protein
MLKTLPASLSESQLDSWVKQQQQKNLSIEWVTRTNQPIPAAWAPSEEADHIVYTDNNDQWFQQLVFQAREHLSSWIVFYGQAEPAAVQKAKTIGIPVMDMNSAVSADVNWAAVFAGLLAMMDQNSWKAGIVPYTEQEIQAVRLNG